MRRKDILLLIIIILIAIAAVLLVLSKKENINVSNVTVIANKEANNEGNINNNFNTDSEIVQNSNNNLNQNINNKEITFENFFKAAYLAKFTGQSDPPIGSEFATSDKIVASVRVAENLKTESKMNFKIYKDEKLISETGELEILNGEVGLKNPGKKGDYIIKLFVDNILVKSLPFKIN